MFSAEISSEVTWKKRMEEREGERKRRKE